MESTSYCHGVSPELQALMEEAWEARIANFPMEITAVFPVKTKAVSVTGSDCALDCAHCGKHYLKGMLPLEEALAGKDQQQPSSYLISGGSTLQGKVPLMPHLETLQRMKENARLNLHAGLVSKEEARDLAEVADVVSFDFTGSKEIIRTVYGLDREPIDYLNSYRALAEYLGSERVIPHITIGLPGGNPSHEIQSAKILAAEGIESLALLVFVPTPGTRFGSLSPPDIQETAAVVAQIRILLPAVPVFLGCMRPGGKYRTEFDKLAIGCGINKIVKPAPDFEIWARERGLKIHREEECCAL